jgi:tRNA threonylcarbamoyl adenosine modification protein (Sua5/YciO/YrdC/YwlC family)
VATEIIKIHPEYPEIDKIVQCAKIIRQGGLVIFPTETVYGIAADYNNPKAMERLREVKKREPGKHFSIHISQKELFTNYSSMTDQRLYKLIDEFWPGPLTVIIPAHEEGQTVGIRMPKNEIAIHLIEASQCTMAAPSANFAGQPPPSTCDEALKDLDGLVDIAIDGGPAKFGQASSVVDFMGELPAVVREGAITQKEVDRITQKKVVLFVCTGNSCRSVMAEYLLKNEIRDRNDVDVISAGTGVFLRASASAETISVLKKEGIDASMHQAQPINNILLHKADLILVMTKMHRVQVLERVASAEQRVYLLRELASQPASGVLISEIPDPMGRPAEVYEECMLTIKDAIDKVIQLI